MRAALLVLLVCLIPIVYVGRFFRRCRGIPQGIRDTSNIDGERLTR